MFHLNSFLTDLYQLNAYRNLKDLQSAYVLQYSGFYWRTVWLNCYFSLFYLPFMVLGMIRSLNSFRKAF